MDMLFIRVWYLSQSVPRIRQLCVTPVERTMIVSDETVPEVMATWT